MKHHILFLIISFITLPLGAQQITFSKEDTFMIKEMNIDTITIGGEQLKEQDVFDYTKVINWRGIEGDYFKALWVGHDKYFIFRYSKNIRNGLAAIHYIRSNKSIHKGVGYAKDVFNDIFYVPFDTLYMPPVIEEMDDNHYFIFRYNGKIHRIPYMNEHVLYITLPEYQFKFDENGKVKLRVCYISNDSIGNKIETSVTSEMTILKINLK